MPVAASQWNQTLPNAGRHPRTGLITEPAKFVAALPEFAYPLASYVAGKSMALLGSQLRIRAAQPPSRRGDAEPAPPGRGAINLDNILKLIPGEVVPLYITGSGLVVPVLGERGWPVVVFVICLVICLFLRAVASRPVEGTGLLRGANLGLVVVSGISFFLWAHAISEGGPLVWVLPQSAWGFLAMAFSVVAPVLVKDK